MTTELAGIRRQVRDAEIRDASIYVSGVGREKVIVSMNRIMAKAPDAVIMAGFCGAADPGLKTGDIHVAQSFRAVDGSGRRRGSITPDEELASALTTAARSKGCRVVTAPSGTVSSVAGTASKVAIRRHLGVASVNMEDYWAACAASSAGIPFASVRVVLDTADQDLPPWISLFANNVLRSAWSVCTHPARIPTLLLLWRQARLARSHLTRCLCTAAEALAPPHSMQMAATR